MRRSGERKVPILSRPKAPTSGGSALRAPPWSGSASRREKRLALASVMMKLLTPVLTMAKPFSQPSSAAERQRPERGRPGPAAPSVLHQVAGRHHRADADRADGEVHAAGREHHHLREADDDVDGERAAEREEVEGREEARRQRGEDDPEADDDGEQPDLRRRAGEIEPPPRRRLAYGTSSVMS